MHMGGQHIWRYIATLRHNELKVMCHNKLLWCCSVHISTVPVSTTLHHDMERLSVLLVIFEGIHHSSVISPHKGPVMPQFVVKFVVTLNKLTKCSWNSAFYTDVECLAAPENQLIGWYEEGAKRKLWWMNLFNTICVSTLYINTRVFLIFNPIVIYWGSTFSHRLKSQISLVMKIAW